MSDLFRNVEARTRLAGTNKLEILLFSLGVDPRTGRRDTFGLNVFKVREVLKAPPVTAAPEMPSVVEGMVSMRGILVPVIHLGRYTGIATDTPPEVRIISWPLPAVRNASRVASRESGTLPRSVISQPSCCSKPRNMKRLEL